jgi:hypothetical protein|tara:strand:+ start:445 stop:801 length:357 start_codon:yes stop_codon:yes gene_type:complete
MRRRRKKNSFGLKVRGHAASAARLVMKLVSRINGIDKPSTPTAQVSPTEGIQGTLSYICKPLMDESYPFTYAATVIKNVVRVIPREYHLITLWLSGKRGIIRAAVIGNKIAKLNQGIK